MEDGRSPDATRGCQRLHGDLEEFHELMRCIKGQGRLGSWLRGHEVGGRARPLGEGPPAEDRVDGVASGNANQDIAACEVKRAGND
jgi:hypothetical protein